MKNEAGTGRSPNIHWKQIFHRVAREALTQGPESREWKTLLKLLEIVRNPEAFLSFQGRQIIRWKNEARGKIVFVKKCQDHISPNIFSLMKSTIDSSAIPKERKNLFYQTLEENQGQLDYFSRREEDPHNMYYQHQNEEDMEHFEKPSKKLKTDTVDFTFTSDYNSKEQDDIYMETEDMGFQMTSQNSNNNQIKNVEINGNEEEKFNVIYSQKNGGDFHDNNPNYHFIPETPLAIHGDDKDSMIEQLRRELREKAKLLEEKNNQITKLQDSLKKINSIECPKEINNEDELNQDFGFKFNLGLGDR